MKIKILKTSISECEFQGDSQEIITPLERCGTKAYYNDSHIIYKNQVCNVFKMLSSFTAHEITIEKSMSGPKSALKSSSTKSG